jgi:glyoxylase-like metal-dependent hydrolase (beta-lactamase superfamily II)
VVGQSIARFGFDSVLQPESTRRLAGLDWDIHAAPGHDTHAVLLFEPASGTLISGDALWAQGFGVVFPELDGDAGFEDVAATLDLIARLPVNTVIPGHGAVFSDVAGALAAARQRLDNFVKNPMRHHRHAAKVMLKYKLLEWGHISEAALHRWLTATPMFHRLFALLHPQIEPSPSQFDTWTSELLADLAHSGALTLHQGWVSNK